jgi:SMODS and SLOG-associating 2TM effector domain family 4
MPPGELISAAEHLRTKVRAYRVAHFAAGDHLRAFHYLLGFALIAMSALVSGSVLQSTEGNPSKSLTLTTGILSTLVVILTAIQTTFKLGERGEAHRSAADGFGRIDRRLEIFVHRNHPDLPKAWDELGAISEEVGNVETGAPSYMRRTYRKALAEVEQGAGDEDA